MLKSRGVEVIFGIPGVHNQELYRGIEEAGITHVLARHEQGAGFMADGYARATGKPGVAYVITGPGLCNIMTPLGQAYSDSVQVLAISSCLDETAATKGQLHQMRDQAAAARAVCDWSEIGQSASATYTLIDRAFAEFQTERKRPKHITVPIAQLEAQAPPPPLARASDIMRIPGCDDTTARHIANALTAARRPMIVLGGGAIAPEMRATVDVVAKHTGAATFTTYAGRGLVADDAPLHFGALLARPDSARIFAKSDLVLAIGTELSEVDLWRPTLGAECPMIRVDIDPACFGAMDHPKDMMVQADAAATLSAVITALPPDPSGSDWSATEVRDFRAHLRAEIDAERPGILPVVDRLKQCLPKDTLIYSDMTQFAYAAKEIYPMDAPGLWHHPYGFGTLGYALPAAIGGKIGSKSQPVLAIAGDYGFQYTIQELIVAVELGLSLPIIVWDNEKLGEIEDSMVRAQIAPNAVVQSNPDFLALAKAYGAKATSPKHLDALETALRDAFLHAGPTLIHVSSDIAL
jgi:acetolactate synthase-1/2/3 large subunit/5-guanidino-2-oxopentanoate decarboxylase